MTCSHNKPRTPGPKGAIASSRLRAPSFRPASLVSFSGYLVHRLALGRHPEHPSRRCVSAVEPRPSPPPTGTAGAGRASALAEC